MRRLLALLPLALATGCMGIPIHARTQPKPLPAPSDALRYEWVEVAAEEGVTLRGVYADSGGPPVLLLYGSGMGIAGSMEAIQMLHDGGYSVLCCDYRGTGYSSGRWWTSRRLDDDARALWEWLLREKGAPAGVVGISIGTIGAASLLDHASPPAAAVLDRPIDPRTVIYRYLAKHVGAVGGAVARAFVRPKCDVKMREQLARAKAPTLLTLPEHDILCPPEDVERMIGGRSAAVSKVTLRGGHLSTHLVDPTAWRSAVLDFLDLHLRPGAPPGGGRTVPPDPFRVLSAEIEGRRLRVAFQVSPPPGRVTVLLCGEKANACVIFEDPRQAATIELPWRDVRRIGPLFGARAVPESFRRAIGTRWINGHPSPGPPVRWATPPAHWPAPRG
ncbi:MAG: alpha/beta hydrolase [Planctomycetota bacterium]